MGLLRSGSEIWRREPNVKLEIGGGGGERILREGVCWGPATAQPLPLTITAGFMLSLSAALSCSAKSDDEFRAKNLIEVL
jgi:hypothetical protein